MACQFDVVLSVLIKHGYQLNYGNGQFEKYIPLQNQLYLVLKVELEEIHTMNGMEIDKYLKQKELEALDII